jgi:hypothetical protein
MLHVRSDDIAKMKSSRNFLQHDFFGPVWMGQKVYNLVSFLQVKKTCIIFTTVEPEQNLQD